MKLIYLSRCWASRISTEMTYPPICRISCVQSTKLSAPLWPLHLQACWVVTLIFMHQPGCLLTCDLSISLDAQLRTIHLAHYSVMITTQLWSLLSNDLSTSTTAQLWSVHQPVCSVWSAAQFTCFKAPHVFKCNFHFYLHVLIYIWVKWGTIVISCSLYVRMVWWTN